MCCWRCRSRVARHGLGECVRICNGLEAVDLLMQTLLTYLHLGHLALQGVKARLLHERQLLYGRGARWYKAIKSPKRNAGHIVADHLARHLHVER